MANLNKLPIWLITAAVLTALSILAHEVTHYIGAVAMGARDVAISWGDYTYDPASLDAMGVAVTAMSAPLLTHIVILWVWRSGATNALALALGLGACSRDIVIFPFALKIALGRDLSTFTNDEMRASEALGISPFPFALVAAVLGIGGVIVFLRRAYRVQGWLFALALFVGTILGLVLWGKVGPMVLAGGRGFN